MPGRREAFVVERYGRFPSRTAGHASTQVADRAPMGPRETCPNGHERTAALCVDLAMRLLRAVPPTAIAVAACALGVAPAVGATWTNVPSQAVGSGSALSDVDALS